MSEIKVNASIILPGRVLPAEPPLLKNGKKERKKKRKEEKEEEKTLISYHQETIRFKDKTPIVINVRDAKPVKQIIRLSKEAYSAMVSAENPVKGTTSFMWKKLSARKRLQAHLQVMANALGGKLDDFSILED